MSHRQPLDAVWLDLCNLNERTIATQDIILWAEYELGRKSLTRVRLRTVCGIVLTALTDLHNDVVDLLTAAHEIEITQKRRQRNGR